MEGLSETATCPECASTTRLRKAVTGTPAGSSARTWLWAGTLVVSIISSVLMAITLELANLEAACLQGAMAAMALGVSALTRSLVRWLPPAVIVRFAMMGILAITSAAVVFALIVRADHLPIDLTLLVVFLIVVWPFCGYGMALAIATAPADAWIREVMLRVQHADRHE
jgi:hypothetical protein